MTAPIEPTERAGTAPDARPMWAGRALALVGIVLVAVNLRTAVASLSPVLDAIEHDIALSAPMVGFLGMLPPLCFALFGISTPLFARRIGLERLLVIALGLLTVGLLGRGFVSSALGLMLASALVFAAIGIGNVLLPPLVKRYFPDRVGLMTTIYVTAMAISTLVPPLVAVPVADASSWRVSLGQWAVFAALALVPWIALLVHPRRGTPAAPETADPRVFRHTFRSPLAWALMTVFAVSGFTAYSMFAWLPALLTDVAGVTPAAAGALLALFAGIGLPASLVVPMIAERWGRVKLMIGIAMGSLVVGYLGLLFAPTTATWVWVALVGAGPLTFPLALVLINLRTRSHVGSVALSGFVQSLGYVIVALGPMLVGVLHSATGGWTVPIIVLAAVAIPGSLAGVIVARPHQLEDELD